MMLDELSAGVFEAALNEAEATELSVVLKALADPVRIRLVSMIATAPDGEICACDLPGAVGRSQPTVSHHLSYLVDAGLVQREQRGRWAWFRVDRERFGLLCSILGAGDC